VFCRRLREFCSVYADRFLSQCKDFRTSEIWVNRGDLETARAAELIGGWEKSEAERSTVSRCCTSDDDSYFGFPYTSTADIHYKLAIYSCRPFTPQCLPACRPTGLPALGVSRCLNLHSTARPSIALLHLIFSPSLQLTLL